jgi:hypothetical protein
MKNRIEMILHLSAILADPGHLYAILADLGILTVVTVSSSLMRTCVACVC